MVSENRCIFFLAYLVAYMMQPLVNFCERRLRARWLGVAFVILGLVVALGVFSLLLSNLLKHADEFSRRVPHLVAQFDALAQRSLHEPKPTGLKKVAFQVLGNSYFSVTGILNDLSERLSGSLRQYVKGGGLLGSVRLVVGSLVHLVVFLSMTLYLLFDFARVQRSLVAAMPQPLQLQTKDVTEKLEHAFGTYFRGQIIIALIVGVLIGGGLFVLGVPLATSLGFLAAMFNIVPYFGVVIAIVPSLLLAASVSWLKAVFVLGVFVAVNQLEAHLLSPLILGKATKLHPVTVILAILLGDRLFGLWGAVFAVPVAAFLKLLYEAYYLKSRLYRSA